MPPTIPGCSHLNDVIPSILAMQRFHCTDVQSPKNLRARIHPQLVPAMTQGKEACQCLAWAATLPLSLPLPAEFRPATCQTWQSAQALQSQCWSSSFLKLMSSWGTKGERKETQRDLATQGRAENPYPGLGLSTHM